MLLDISKCYKSGSVWNHKHLSWGVYGIYWSNKKPWKIQRHITNTDKIQRNAHGHSTLPTRSFIHQSFIRSLIQSHNTSHHSCNTQASPIHHTLHLNASYHASPIHHTASQHIIPLKDYIQQITLHIIKQQGINLLLKISKYLIHITLTYRSMWKTRKLFPYLTQRTSACCRGP